MSEQSKLAFEAWYDNDIDEPLPTDYTIMGKRYLYMGWQAAKAESEKEIVDIKEKLRLSEYASDAEAKFADKLSDQIYELQASNNTLREALIVCKQYITEAIIDDKYHEASCGLDELYLLRDKAINLYNAAISAPRE